MTAAAFRPARSCRLNPAPYRPAQTAASPGMSDGTPFLRVAADRIGAPGSARIAGKMPFRATNAKLGPQSSGSARRWPSFEGELHVERFRATLNGLGGFHMGNLR